MKNTLKSFGIIAFVAIIGFSVAACNNNDDNGGEHTGPGSRSVPIVLQENVWHNGIITSRGQTLYFAFEVTAGTTYRLWVNDKYEGDGSKTLDVEGIITLPSGERIEWDDHWLDPETFTPGTSGRVQVEVRAFMSSETGTFGIVFTTGTSRPE